MEISEVHSALLGRAAFNQNTGGELIKKKKKQPTSKAFTKCSPQQIVLKLQLTSKSFHFRNTILVSQLSSEFCLNSVMNRDLKHKNSDSGQRLCLI